MKSHNALSKRALKVGASDNETDTLSKHNAPKSINNVL